MFLYLILRHSKVFWVALFSDNRLRERTVLHVTTKNANNYSVVLIKIATFLLRCVGDHSLNYLLCQIEIIKFIFQILKFFGKSIDH